MKDENIFRLSKLPMKSPMIGKIFEEKTMTTERELQEWRDRRATQHQSVKLRRVKENPWLTVMVLIGIAAFMLAWQKPPKSEPAPRQIPETVVL